MTETIQCPFCGESFEIQVEAGPPMQTFVTDCEICCRPMEVRVECEAGEVLSVSVAGN